MESTEVLIESTESSVALDENTLGAVNSVLSFFSEEPILLAALFIILICLIVITFLKLFSKKEDPNAIFVSNKGTKSGLQTRLCAMYDFLSSISFLTSFLENIRMRYDVICPTNKKFSKEKAMRLCLLVWGTTAVILIVCLLFFSGFYAIISVLTVSLLLSRTFIRNDFEKCEMRLLNQFLDFMSFVQQNFIDSGMIDEAIFETLYKLPSMMKNHAELLYDTITADDVDEAVFKYSSAVSNRFLRQFLEICTITMVYGDTLLEDGSSSFLHNLRVLQSDVHEYLIDQSVLRAKFSFLTVISTVPIFALEPIRLWASSNIQELTAYYKGFVGIFVEFLIFMVVFLITIMIENLRNPYSKDLSEHRVLRFFENIPLVDRMLDNYEFLNYGKVLRTTRSLKSIGSKLTPRLFLVKKWLTSVCVFLLANVTLVIGVVSVRTTAINDLMTMNSMNSGVSEEDLIASIVILDHYVKQSVDRDWLAEYQEATGVDAGSYSDAVHAFIASSIQKEASGGIEGISVEEAIPAIQAYNSIYQGSSTLQTAFLGDGSSVIDETLPEYGYAIDQVEKILEKITKSPPIYDELLLPDTCEKIADRICRYYNTYYKWYFIIICLGLAFLAFWVPDLFIRVRLRGTMLTMEDEVIDFMAIISVLRNVKRTSIHTILEWINTFSYLFKDSVEVCLNEYPSLDLEALKNLREKEPYHQFRRLVDRLIDCDKIGVSKAFSNVEIERELYQKQKATEEKIRIDSAATSASFISLFPLYSVIIGYLIVPFLMQAFTSFLTYTQQMSTL